MISIVPDPKENVWFVVEDDENQTFPRYEGTPMAIVKVIGE